MEEGFCPLRVQSGRRERRKGKKEVTKREEAFMAAGGDAVSSKKKSDLPLSIGRGQRGTTPKPATPVSGDADSGNPLSFSVTDGRGCSDRSNSGSFVVRSCWTFVEQNMSLGRVEEGYLRPQIKCSSCYIFPSSWEDPTGIDECRKRIGRIPGCLCNLGYCLRCVHQCKVEQRLDSIRKLEIEKALLQQVMSLTAEQIDLLPPEQRQVLQLQQMLMVSAASAHGLFLDILIKVQLKHFGNLCGVTPYSVLLVRLFGEKQRSKQMLICAWSSSFAFSISKAEYSSVLSGADNV